MRIFSAVRHSLDPRYYYGGHWSGNFYPALQRLGHEIVESQVDLKPAWDVAEGTPEHRRVRADITQRVIDEVKKAHGERSLELFLSYFYNAHFDPDGFEELHRLGIPTINFYCNSIYQFELVANIAPKARFAWHAEKHARDSYLKVGANPVWVQMGADPELYRPMPVAAREPKACFVGLRYADRDRLAAALIRAGVPVDLYGSGWSGLDPNPAPPASGSSAPGSRRAYLKVMWRNVRIQGIVGGLSRNWRQWRYRRQTRALDPLLATVARGRARDIAGAFSQYEVVLNFSNVWADGRPGTALIPHVRLRDFEAPMCRACYLTGHTDEIEEFYKIGAEIDTYRGPEELVDKARYYLAHSEAAERLREAGYQRAVRDHTWERRFEELFRKTGLVN
jgi:hypothetical protein